MNKKIFYLLFFVLIAFGCHKHNVATVQRTYRMGLQNSAPRPELNLYLQALNIWSSRADAAMITTEVPWDSLLHGVTPEQFVVNNHKDLVNFYRSKNLKIWVYIDPQNGLDRSRDADALVAAGKSIAQSNMQLLYRKFVVAMDSIIKPEHLGLALETNLIRVASSNAIYQGVKQAANDAALDVRLVDSKVKLSISVQVDLAWGNLGTSSYTGIAQDFTDFPFMEELGLSSYPYLSTGSPNNIPINYYSRLTEGRSIPVFVSEGGWTSQSIIGFSGQAITSDPQTQRDYISLQSKLLDQAKAIAWFQLTFSDIDLSALPPSTPPNLKYFAYLGLVDINLQPKPAMAIWDSVFNIPLKPGH
jgi:hypothetical protein